jgi:two-component system, LytTR family, sensor histidine kinase AgrC
MVKRLQCAEIIKLVLMTVLDILGIALLRCGIMLYYSAHNTFICIVLQLLSYILFVITNIIFIRQEYMQKEEKKKMLDCVKLNNSYLKQIEYMRIRQHDLKNQLSVINGILDEGLARLNDNSRAFINHTNEQVNEISMLLKLDNTSIGMLLFDKYKQAYEKGIELKLKSYIADLPSSFVQNQFDLVDIMGNLLDNAIDAAGSGGEIYVEIGEIDGFIYFSVMNSGDLVGGDVNDVFRAGFSTKGEHRGYGLYNVRRIVMKHGGNIELAVNDGKVEFRVYLPVTA